MKRPTNTVLPESQPKRHCPATSTAVSNLPSDPFGNVTNQDSEFPRTNSLVFNQNPEPFIFSRSATQENIFPSQSFHNPAENQTKSLNNQVSFALSKLINLLKKQNPDFTDSTDLSQIKELDFFSHLDISSQRTYDAEYVFQTIGSCLDLFPSLRSIIVGQLIDTNLSLEALSGVTAIKIGCAKDSTLKLSNSITDLVLDLICDDFILELDQFNKLSKIEILGGIGGTNAGRRDRLLSDYFVSGQCKELIQKVEGLFGLKPQLSATFKISGELHNLSVLNINDILHYITIELPDSINDLTINVTKISANGTLELLGPINKLKTLVVHNIGTNGILKLPTNYNNFENLTVGNFHGNDARKFLKM